MTGFTEGNWTTRRSKTHIDGAYDYGIGAKIDDAEYCIAEAFGRVAEDQFMPAEANARLMSKSPNLYRVLKALLSDWSVATLEDAAKSDPNDTDSARGTAAIFREARALLSEIQGETSDG